MITATDLQPFCSRDPKRETLHMPWSEGDKTYATDGRIAVMVDRVPDVMENPEAPKGLAVNIFGPFNNITKSIEVPDVGERTEPESVHCPECRGSGVCKLCDNGSCHHCKGEGVVMIEEKPWQINGEFGFNRRYLRLIQKLPNLRLFLDLENEVNMARFTFDGGEGRLALIYIE